MRRREVSAGRGELVERPPAELVHAFLCQLGLGEQRSRLEGADPHDGDLLALVARLAGPREDVAPRPYERPDVGIDEACLLPQLAAEPVLELLAGVEPAAGRRPELLGGL